MEYYNNWEYIMFIKYKSSKKDILSTILFFNRKQYFKNISKKII